ncbi:hypothetical protein AYO44_06325 [Planctomycetaceae bacterium SCGC AG-212-F19]|nr:hypothetical protein AYO44_06325 [Planctomycetaceae bacterium SCGC AG-212-F19]
MKCLISPRCGLAVLLAVLGLAGATHGAEPVRANGWIMNDLAAARAEARQTGKPIFVTFRCEA